MTTDWRVVLEWISGWRRIVSVAVATAVAAVVAASVGIGVAGSWSLLLSESLGPVPMPHKQIEGLLLKRGPEVIMDSLQLCRHPVGPRCPGVGFHLHQLFNSSLKPIRPLDLLGYGGHFLVYDACTLLLALLLGG